MKPYFQDDAVQIKDYTVRQIPASQTYEWLLKKHYVHRIPPISFAFGLYSVDNILQGVCTLGIPASRFNLNNTVYELNRLVVNIGLPSGTLSYFVARCLKLFPERPVIIVSYADANVGHHGYIYQSTNWLYTGLSASEDNFIVDGKQLHRKTLYNIYGISSVSGLAKQHEVKIEEQSGKHRYFMFLGSKSQVKEIKKNFPYQQIPYPKGDNQRYDASYEPPTQGVLV